MVFDDAQDLLVPENHPLTRRSEVRLSDAATECWIVKPGNNDSYDLLIAACAAAGLHAITTMADEPAGRWPGIPASGQFAQAAAIAAVSQ